MATMKAANAKQRQLAAMTDEQLLAELRGIADDIDAVNARRDRLYADRKAVFAEGRRREPPIGTRILGEAARCSDVLVTQLVGTREKKDGPTSGQAKTT